MNKIAFTIVAKNYVVLANILAKSIFEKDKDIEFYVFIADEPEEEIKSEIPGVTYVVAKHGLNFAEDLWQQLSFKYDLTEFCTAIKPACFTYLMGISPDCKIIFFDPDIAVYNSLNPIYNELDTNFIVVTPHVTTPQDVYTGEALETDF